MTSIFTFFSGAFFGAVLCLAFLVLATWAAGKKKDEDKDDEK